MQRARWLFGIAAAAALGAAAGAAVAATGHPKSTAEAKVVVQAKGGPAVVRPQLPNLRELATSSLLAGNVDATLRLRGSADELRKRLHASIAPASEVVILSVSDRQGDRARQITQEAGVVFAQLVRARFKTPALQAVILDPAHVVSHEGRPFLRDLLIGAGIGLALAVLVLALRGRFRPVPDASADGRLALPERELEHRVRDLEQRIETTTAREAALARHAAELARRERALERRESAVEAAVAERQSPPPPEQGAIVITETSPSEPAPPAPPQGHTLDELERAVRQNTMRFPEQADTWEAYLFYLREHAAADGRLPPYFDVLIREVFGPILS